MSLMYKGPHFKCTKALVYSHLGYSSSEDHEYFRLKYRKKGRYMGIPCGCVVCVVDRINGNCTSFSNTVMRLMVDLLILQFKLLLCIAYR